MANDYDLTGCMKLKTTMTESKTHFSLIRWLVKNYNELKYDVLYFQMYESRNFNCVFKLIKTVENLNVALRFDYTDAGGKFYLASLEDSTWKLVDAEEISKGLYVADFPHEIVFHERGQHNKTGILQILFKYETGSKTIVKSNPYGKLGVLSNVDEMLDCMKIHYLFPYMADFKIHVAEKSFLVHKCILFARSKFFQAYFQENKKAEDFSPPDVLPGIMYEVLQYIYTGELSNMSTESMVKVFETAYLLNIQSLKDRCSRFFEETHNWRVLREVSFWEYAVQ